MKNTDSRHDRKVIPALSPAIVLSIRMLAFGMTGLGLVAIVSGDAEFCCYMVAMSNVLLWLSLIAEPKSPNDRSETPAK